MSIKIKPCYYVKKETDLIVNLFEKELSKNDEKSLLIEKQIIGEIRCYTTDKYRLVEVPAKSIGIDLVDSEYLAKDGSINYFLIKIPDIDVLKPVVVYVGKSSAGDYARPSDHSDKDFDYVIYVQNLNRLTGIDESEIESIILMFLKKNNFNVYNSKFNNEIKTVKYVSVLNAAEIVTIIYRECGVTFIKNGVDSIKIPNIRDKKREKNNNK